MHVLLRKGREGISLKVHFGLMRVAYLEYPVMDGW
jgi:hypothetical protein